MIEIENRNVLGAGKVDIWQIIKSVKGICNSCQKVSHFASECWSKNKINSVDEKKPEGIYYINLSASESDREIANNITPKPEEKKLSKVRCEINSVDINFSADSEANVNMIDINTLQNISKVCEIGLKTTNSKIYSCGPNNPLKLKGKFNSTTKNSGFEVYTWFFEIDKL